MQTLIAYIIAGFSFTALITLWFVIAYRELARKKREVIAAFEQVQLHNELHEQAQNSPNTHTAKKMLDTSRMIYTETVNGYNHCLKNIVYCFPGWVMGFRQISKHLYQRIAN